MSLPHPLPARSRARIHAALLGLLASRWGRATLFFGTLLVVWLAATKTAEAA
jgi:hypothetical protein